MEASLEVSVVLIRRRMSSVFFFVDLASVLLPTRGLSVTLGNSAPLINTQVARRLPAKLVSASVKIMIIVILESLIEGMCTSYRRK